MSVAARSFQYLSASVSQGIFGVISLLVVLPALSNSDLGYVAALETLAYLFSTLIGFNLDRVASRFYFLKDESLYIQKLYATLNYFVLITIVAGVCGVIVFQNFISQIFPELSFMPLIILMLVKTSIDIYLKVEAAFLVASSQSEIHSKSTILSGFTGIILSSIFVIIFQLGVLGFVVAQVIASFVRLIYLITVSMSGRSPRVFDIAILKSSLSYAWPFFPTLVFAWIISYYDRILINQFLGIESLGIYTLSLKLAGTLLLVTGSLVSAIYPIFYAVYDKVESKRDIDVGINFSSALIVILFFSALSLLTIGSLLFEFLIGPRVEAPLTYFGFLVLNYWIGAVGFIATESLMRARATTLNMVLSFFLAMVAIGLNYLLIPFLGISGAIVSGFITYALGFLLQLYAARQFVTVPFCWGTYVRALSIIVVGACILMIQPGWYFKVGLFIAGLVLMWTKLQMAIIFFKKFG